MPNLIQLRTAAREIFEETLRAVDPQAAVLRAVQNRQSRLSICDIEISNRTIYSIAIGKAALAMAYGLEQALEGFLTGGILSGSSASPTQQEWLLASPWQWFAGGHPLPDRQSLDAASAALQLIDQANKEHALIIFLISGGGSAMMEWPISGDITLPNLRMANKALINCGASISEVNAVRRAFSFIKGGRMAEKAPNCDQITLIVSDVPTGQECNVASGPSLAPPATELTPQEVVARYSLRSVLPEAVVRIIDADQKPAIPARNDSAPLRKHFVLLDNNSALEAAARAGCARGFTAEIAMDISDQAIETGCAKLLNRLDQFAQQADISSSGVCLVSGGEFSCPVRGKGIGGRNLETALRLAIESDEGNRDSRSAPQFVALCAGTDGIDGNSPAAGALVDNTTIARARGIGLDPQEFLSRSDSYSFFVALGDVIAIGPTGTNVRDLRILLQNRSG